MVYILVKEIILYKIKLKIYLKVEKNTKDYKKNQKIKQNKVNIKVFKNYSS